MLDGFSLVEVTTFLAVFARIVAWTFAAPYISSNLPGKFRVIVAALLSLVLAGARPKAAPETLWLIVPGEILIGLVAGYAARIAIAGAEAAGQLVGLQLELGFANTLDPSVHEEALPTRRIAYTLAGLTFLAVGGLESSLRALAVCPVAGERLGRVVAHLVDGSGDVLIMAVRASAPMMLTALVANLAVGLASRAAPAMNIFSVMLACVLTVGAIVLIITAPVFASDLLAVGRRAADAAAYVLLH